MSIYYYFVCERDRTRVYAGHSSQGNFRLCAEDSAEWLQEHAYEDIQLVSEHWDNLHMYEED